MRKFAEFVSTALLATTCIASGVTQKNGYVPDEMTAIRIAKAVLEPILTKDQLNRSHPFKAELHDGVWKVFTVPKAHIKGGGTPELRIDRQTAAVLSLQFSR
jgi:NTF2 fold immunity protein